MSHFTQGQNGVAAVENRQWTEGVGLLSKAIEQVKSPPWLLARAHAYQQLGELGKALADAELAYIAASERTQEKSRAQMILAQYRRAVILHKMGRFADSDACCLWSMHLIEGMNFRTDEDTVSANVDENGDYKATAADAKASAKHMPSSGLPGTAARGASEWTRAYVWRSMALAAMEKLPEGDAGRKITISRIPRKQAVEINTKKDVAAERVFEAQVAKEKSKESDAKKAKQREEMLARWAKEKLKIDFYQSNATVNFIIYVKNVDKDKLKVYFGDSEIQIFNMPQPNTLRTAAVLELAGQISEDRGSRAIRVTPIKVELTAVKKNPGVKWSAWGAQRIQLSDEAPSTINPEAAAQKNPEQAASTPVRQTDKSNSPHSSESYWNDTPPKNEDAADTPSKKEAASSPSDETPALKPSGPPAYPTSSKSGPKDWERIGNEDDDGEEKSDVNHFFKTLYATSTPEQQRAMMKSFTESNGTALSTDWDDVKSRKVETHPPEGVEAKKW